MTRESQNKSQVIAVAALYIITFFKACLGFEYVMYEIDVK